MFRENLPPDDGMLFLMGREYDWTFWMHNTLIPLDMIFITNDMTVAGIVERAEPHETLRSVGAPSVRARGQRRLDRPTRSSAGAKVTFAGVTATPPSMERSGEPPLLCRHPVASTPAAAGIGGICTGTVRLCAGGDDAMTSDCRTPAASPRAGPCSRSLADRAPRSAAAPRIPTTAPRSR